MFFVAPSRVRVDIKEPYIFLFLIVESAARSGRRNWNILLLFIYKVGKAISHSV
jgi:hypothetical protein